MNASLIPSGTSYCIYDFAVVLQGYIRAVMPHIPTLHWIVIGVTSIAFAWWRIGCKKDSVYGGAFFGLAVFWGLFILDALVIARIGVPHYYKSGLDLVAEYQRMTNGDREFWIFLILNIVAFSPLGILVSEAMYATGRRCVFRNTVLAAFGLSLLVESLQWILQVGFFEVTDMVLNTLGAAIGAVIVLGVKNLARGKNESEL